MTGWPWPLDAVQNFFESLWNNIHKWIVENVNKVWDWIISGLKWFYTTYIDPFIKWVDENIAKPINSFFSYLWDSLVSFYKSYIEPGLRFFANETAYMIQNLLSGKFDLILTRIGAYGEAIKTFIKDTILPLLPKELQDWAKGAYYTITEKVVPSLAGIGKQIGDTFSGISNALSLLGKSILDNLSSAKNAILSAFDGAQTAISDAIKSVFGGMAKLGEWLWSGMQFIGQKLVEFGGWLWSGLQSLGMIMWEGIKSLGGAIAGAGQAIFSGFSELASRISGFFSDVVLKPLASMLDVSTKGIHEAIGLKSPQTIFMQALTPLAPLLAAYVGLGIVTKMAEGAGDTHIEAATFGIRPGFLKVLSGIDLRGLIGAVLTGYVTGLAMSYFSGTVMEQVRRESLETGRPIPPSPEEAARMLWRGAITKDLYLKAIRRHGLMAEFENGYIELTKQIPGPSDIIRFFVREAYAPEFEAKYPEKFAEYPPEFGEWMKKAGFEEFWAKSYWAAHWVLPSPGQVYEMLWRKLLTLDAVKAFLKEADIDPRWRENLVEIAYKLPGRIEARWGLEWGVWDEEKFREFLLADGLHPRWLDDVVKAEKANVFREHLNAIMSAAKRAYQRGFVTKEQFMSTIAKLGYPEEVQKLRAWEADILQDIELKEDIMKATIQEFREGKIDDRQLREVLSGIIVIPEKLEQIIRLEVARAQRRALAKPTLETELERLKTREVELMRKYTDLVSDLEAAKRLRDAEMKIWQEKIEKQTMLIEAETRPERRAKLEADLRVLQSQMERARVYHENKIAELEETIKFVTTDLEGVRSKIEATKRAIQTA